MSDYNSDCDSTKSTCYSEEEWDHMSVESRDSNEAVDLTTSSYHTPTPRLANIFTPPVIDAWVDDSSTDRAKWKLYEDFGAQKSSWVWKYYNRYGAIHNNTKEQNENNEICVSNLRVCLECHKQHHRTEGIDAKIWEINYGKKATGHLSSHFQSKHTEIFGIEDKKVRDKQIGKRGWTTTGNDGPASKRGALATHFNELQEGISNNLLVRWLIADYLPSSTVESPDFRAFCKSLHSKYSFVTHGAIDAMMIRMEIDLKPIIQQMVFNQRVALTTDNWTSNANDNYISLTVHYITEEWKLMSVVLECMPYDVSHSAEHIVEHILAMLKTNGIALDCVSCIVTDTAANMNLAGDGFPFDWHGCLAHLIQLTTNKAFKGAPGQAIPVAEEETTSAPADDDHDTGDDETASTADEPVQPLVDINPRNAGRSRRGQKKTTKKQKAKLLPGPLEKNMRCIRHTVQYFKTSSQAAKSLELFQKVVDPRCTPLTVLQDVVTRWWSTQTMLERATKLRQAIESILGAEGANKTMKAARLTQEQWTLAADLSEILKPFMYFQQYVEGSKYVTISYVPAIIWSIRESLERAVAEHRDKPLFTTLELMLSHFNRNWGSGAAGTVFDEHKTRGPSNRRKGLPLQTMIAAAVDARTKTLKGIPACEHERIWCAVQSRCEAILMEDKDVAKEDNQVLPRATKKAPAVNAVFIDFFADDDGEATAPEEVGGSIRDKSQRIADRVTAELRSFRASPRLVGPPGELGDPLAWWKLNEHLYPTVARLARRVLCIPATSAASERLFSTAGLIVTKKRASLKVGKVSRMVFLHENIKHFDRKKQQKSK